MSDNPKVKRLKKDEDSEEEFKSTVYNVSFSFAFLTHFVVMISFGVPEQNALLEARF